MSDSVRVMIQVRATPSLAAAAFGPVAAAPPVPGISELPGVQFAAGFSPVPIPPKPTGGAPAAAFTVSEPSTYVVRATVNNEALSNFLDQAIITRMLWESSPTQESSLLLFARLDL